MNWEVFHPILHSEDIAHNYCKLYFKCLIVLAGKINLIWNLFLGAFKLQIKLPLCLKGYLYCQYHLYWCFGSLQDLRKFMSLNWSHSPFTVCTMAAGSAIMSSIPVNTDTFCVASEHCIFSVLLSSWQSCQLHYFKNYFVFTNFCILFF